MFDLGDIPVDRVEFLDQMEPKHRGRLVLVLGMIGIVTAEKNATSECFYVPIDDQKIALESHTKSVFDVTDFVEICISKIDLKRGRLDDDGFLKKNFVYDWRGAKLLFIEHSFVCLVGNADHNRGDYIGTAAINRDTITRIGHAVLAKKKNPPAEAGGFIPVYKADIG